MAWTRIPAEKARLHPLYGVGGWLALFVVGLFFGIAQLVLGTAEFFDGLRKTYANALKISGEFTAAQTQAFEQWIWSGALQKYSLLVVADAAISGAIISALFVGLSGKRWWFISLYNVFFVWRLAVCALLVAMLEADNLPSAEAVGGSIGALIGAVPWLLYVNVSRRVRVTTRNQVRTSDPFNENALITNQLEDVQPEASRALAPSLATRQPYQAFPSPVAAPIVKAVTPGPPPARPTLGMAGRLGQVIYWFFCIVAAAIVLLGAWFGRGQFEWEGLLGVCGGALVAWLVGRAILYVLAGR